MMDKVLVVGGDGLIGRALIAHLRQNSIPFMATTHLAEKVAYNRPFLDMTQESLDWEPPQDITAAYLCAAMTSLEYCRANPAQSALVNVHNMVRVGQKLAKNHTFTIFLSTSLVFDGTRPYPRAEDPVSPITTYGHQKAEAERYLLALDPPVTVVRLTKVIGPDMALTKGWIQSLRRGQAIHPFSDMVMSPISLEVAVRALTRVAEQRVEGIIQVSASEDVSYADAARHVAQRLKANLELVQPITSVEAGVYLEAIPVHTAFDTSRLQTELGIPPLSAWSAIDTVIFSEP